MTNRRPGPAVPAPPSLQPWLLTAPRQPWRRGASRRPWLLAVVGCVVLLALPMVGTDVAAHEFRSWLFRTHGPLLWQNQWYGGHLVAGYSPLYPPLAALLGTRLVGALACVAAAAAGSRLLGAEADGPGRLASAWFALACVGLFVQGQYPFVLGLALALAALLAARSGRRWAAGAAALAASLASPLAGAFLLLVALAWLADAGLRAAAPLATAAVGVGVGAVLGGGGPFPFPPESLLTVLVFSVGGLLITRPASRTVTLGLLLFAASSVLLFAVPNAVGGNVARLGALAGGPLATVELGRRGRLRTLAVVAVPLLAWQAWPAVQAWSHAAGDPSSRPDYYTGLQAYLRTQPVTAGRLEVPTLRQHWEAAYLAPAFPLARGWERQVDLLDNAVLYRPALTADQLHAWTLDAGVALIALPDAPLDPWSVREGRLVAAGQPWLTPVWHDAHWRVWRVADAAGLVTGPGRLTRLGIDTADLDADRAGELVVRLRWSPYWRLTTGGACLRRSPGGWLDVQVNRPGPVSLAARWSLPGMIGQGTSGCRADR